MRRRSNFRYVYALMKSVNNASLLDFSTLRIFHKTWIFFFFTSITVVRTLIKAILSWNWKRQVLCHMDYMRIQSFILAFAPIWHCWTFIPDSISFYILFISLFIFQDPNPKHQPTCFKEYLHNIQLIKFWLSLWQNWKKPISNTLITKVKNLSKCSR